MTGGEKLKEQTEENIFTLQYQILNQIGKGGDGTVYLVRHIATGQLRAAKEFRQSAGDSRFRELQALRQLHHPSLPQVFDILESEQTGWLIMEYVVGRSLTRFREESSDPQQFFSLMEQLAEVLLYLHSQKTPVLHLDLKPANILITSNGRLVLIDFGASVPQVQGKWINPCMGTPGFSAPEQKNPEDTIDERTDLYAYGAVMYWYLFGYVFCAEKHRPMFFSWKRAAFRICEKCLREKREERYADSRSLLQSVRRAGRRYRRRRQYRKAAGAAFLLISVLCFSGFMLLEEQRETRWKEAVSAEQQYEQQLLISEDLGLEQAAVCYETAAQLCPERFDWCMHLIERISEDYCFSLEEESILKEMLYSVSEERQQMYAELIQEDPGVYGIFSYKTAIAYWYFYEASGGKRAAAAWFTHAVDSRQQDAAWYEAALLYEKISTYYEKIDRKNENGEQELEYGSYWNDLLNLWCLEYFETERAVIQEQVAQELLSGILLRSNDLLESQIAYEQVESVLRELQQFGKRQEYGEDFLQQCERAAMAAKRVYTENE